FRVARSLASRARYRLGPLFLATSRLIVKGALPSSAAIVRMDLSAARPREISSRSARLSAPGGGVGSGNQIPPRGRKIENTDPGGTPTVSEISVKECPCFHSSQTRRRSVSGSPGRPSFAIFHLYQKLTRGVALTV